MGLGIRVRLWRWRVRVSDHFREYVIIDSRVI